MNKLPLHEVWDLCLDLMYDKSVYVQGLIDTMRRSGVDVESSILDAGCGTGFPLIELTKRGYHVVGADKNIEMTGGINAKACTAGISVDWRNIAWRDLATSMGKNVFDFVYCRGNSLVYADSWAEYVWSGDVSRSAIRTALKNFYDVLTPGGTLYVDIPKSDEEFGIKRVLGSPNRHLPLLEILWEVRHYSTEMRTVNIQVLSVEHGEVAKHKLLSYLLRREELMTFLREAGFSSVSPEVDVIGENHYDVYLALK